MKVLISAYACEPGRGAEPGVGWNLVRELAENHELWVLTRAKHQREVLDCGESWIEKVNWVFIDPPKWLTFWKTGRRGLYPFYALWQREAWRAGKKLQQSVGFDIVHHLTFGQYWVPTPLVNLGPPFVYGPVGGGESTPPGLYQYYSTKGKIREFFRDAIRQWLPAVPTFKEWYLGAAWSFAATKDTEDALRRIGVEKLEILPQSGIGDGDEAERFCEGREKIEKTGSEVLKLVSACRLEHWKAVDLAIEAVALAKEMGVPVKYSILSFGPEEKALKHLVGQLGLQDDIEFTGKLPLIEDVFERVSEADALVHPALHEAFGQSCLEAMALGTPVVCMDWAGPGLIVTEETGYKVVPTSRSETIHGLAESIAACYSDKLAGLSKGLAASERAREAFCWSGLARRISKTYGKVVNQRS
jgi:glycosyltransferase involved in cell wall biosynthesis